MKAPQGLAVFSLATLFRKMVGGSAENHKSCRIVSLVADMSTVCITGGYT